MQMEWILIMAVAACAAMLLLVIRRTARMCARTIFAQPYEPTQEEIEASQTPRTLPETAQKLPKELKRDAIQRAAEQAVLHWMQAVNDRNETQLIEAAGGLSEALTQLQKKQTARGERERFEQPKVHQSVISVIDGRILTVCVSAQAIHYLVCGGQVVGGREDLPEQMLWELVCTDHTAAPLQFAAIKQVN